MNISVDYKVAVSKLILYIRECWKSAKGCNWRVRAAFIQNSQMWEIRKFVGPHTCTSTRMTEDHRKLDSKTICTYIMPMVKDIPTIKVSVLITEIQARFQYRVLYRKAWIAKQMVIEQLYGNFEASYNELQGWIAAIREYVPRTVIELQARPYYGLDDQLQSGKRIFHRMFWTFDQYVRIFPHCKPFVQVDGTWLYGKYTQILLIAVAQDSNRNVLPIAFAIVDKENMESLATLMPRIGQQQVNQIEAGHVFFEDVRDAMVANCRMARRLQTLHYPCAHVVAACAKVNLNVEQFVDDVYTLNRTLRV
ncbi:hypothetical protein PVK06_047023 [Gossypium arboreum]|uniref:MULE transposase domain-containing protein n=1 Tax=Gossypium arboreum TaxID=29729 RepID=A0ABR0MC96_GOSAR|nr:hypothetical protein PVK06_047023 [Gossypium arboreum]